MISFSLLGPLEIHRDGTPLRIGSPKQRTLIIRLLLEDGRHVPVDVLIDDLWRGDPPPTARGTVRSYVSHIRRALEADADLLQSDGRGYRIDVGERTDIAMFDRLSAEAKERLTRNDGLGALRLLDDAMALWRGEPLADVAYEDFARGPAARLRELHLDAQETRFDALLGLGRTPAAIAALEAFVAQEPSRERPHGQLMLALHRAGRTPDALAVFRRYAERLADELGLDPTPTLVALRDRMLRQDPSLDPATTPTTAEPVPPHADDLRPRTVEAEPPTAWTAAPGLPAPLASFVGRADELRRVAGFVERSRLVTCVGPGGAGKTTLVLEALRTIAPSFRDGVWLVPLAAERDPARVPTLIATALGMAADGDVSQRIVSRLDGREALLVLDNCEHLADACARVAEAILRRGRTVRILATSREALGIPGELQMSVPPLSLADATRLFVERAQAVTSALDPRSDAEAIEEICARLDGMPLAIELAAARVRTLSPRAIADRLVDRFELLTTGSRTADERHRTLRSLIDWSHDLLSPEEQTLLRRLAVFRGGWTLDAAEEVCDLEGTARILDPLDRLVDRSLVVRRGERFHLLETILAYADERLDGTDEREPLARRHAFYHAGLAESLEPGLRGPAQGRTLALLQAEEPNLRAALAWCRDHAEECPEVGLGLAASLGWYWYVGRQVDGRHELVAILERTGEARAVARARAQQALSLALRPGGCIVHPHREAATAARASLSLFEELGAPAEGARSRLLAAVEGVTAADPTEALREIERAREQASGDVTDAWTLALADFVEMEVRLHHGEPQAALSLGRRATRRFDELDDAWGRSATRLHLGIGLRPAGSITEAERVLADAVGISRETGLRNNLARSLIELGETTLAGGDAAAATRHFGEAQEVVDDLADDLLTALLAVGRGDADRALGKSATALARYREAAGLLVPLELHDAAVRAHLGAAQAAEQLGDLDAASEHRELARHLTVAG